MKKNKSHFPKGHTPWHKGKSRDTPWMKGESNPAKTLQARKKISDAAKKRKWSPEGLKKLSEIRWKGGREAMIRRMEIKNAGRPRSEFCEICRIEAKELKKRLYFDHDHKTGKFRGWLCAPCNFALGNVKDNVEILQSMIDYLNLSRSQNEKKIPE